MTDINVTYDLPTAWKETYYDTIREGIATMLRHRDKAYYIQLIPKAPLPIIDRIPDDSVTMITLRIARHGDDIMVSPADAASQRAIDEDAKTCVDRKAAWDMAVKSFFDEVVLAVHHGETPSE